MNRRMLRLQDGDLSISVAAAAGRAGAPSFPETLRPLESLLASLTVIDAHPVSTGASARAPHSAQEPSYTATRLRARNIQRQNRDGGGDPGAAGCNRGPVQVDVVAREDFAQFEHGLQRAVLGRSVPCTEDSRLPGMCPRRTPGRGSGSRPRKRLALRASTICSSPVFSSPVASARSRARARGWRAA